MAAFTRAHGTFSRRARQTWTIAGIELRRVFFAKRGLWIYALALLPAVAFSAHAVDAKLRIERLARRGVTDPALRPIAEIVHDIDLKDDKFGREETRGIDRLIAGIAMAHKDDEARLQHGGAVFDSLYELYRRKK